MLQKYVDIVKIVAILDVRFKNEHKLELRRRRRKNGESYESTISENRRFGPGGNSVVSTAAIDQKSKEYRCGYQCNRGVRCYQRTVRKPQ